MTNPLLDQTKLPSFSQIAANHVEPAVNLLLEQNRANLDQLLSGFATSGKQPSWGSLIESLDEWEDCLDRAWSPVSHLNSVKNSKELREAYNRCRPKLTQYATEMGQNQQLYAAYKTISEQKSALSGEQRKVIENAIKDFELAGVNLNDEKKARYQQISQQLTQLTTRFEENVLDATQAWTKQITDIEQLAGLPQSALDLARQTAEQRELEGWLLTLEFPSYLPVMTYADDRNLRRIMYEAFSTRASDQGPNAGQFDNGKIMQEILALRHEKAQLLGFDNFAELSLAKKMAPSTDSVIKFLEDLTERSKRQAEDELAELRAFAKQNDDVHELESWDIPYYSEKYRQASYNISQEEVKPYLPETKVIPGMFEVIARLFGVTIERLNSTEIDVWHPDVRFYEIRDAETGELRGQFYFDLYARQNKRGGAWMDVCQNRLKNSQREQIPVAYMTCNFTPPIGDKPALMTHDEVETLFHEFGHGLHHMLTKVDYPAVSGINGVAWDAVELPSQFMENWCWQPESLALISGHYETDEPISEALFQRMLAAKNFQSAMQMLRQLEFALFDFRLHKDFSADCNDWVEQTLKTVREQVAVVKPPEWNRFPNAFTHIFSGGYAAGYYSYKWAEVLSADAFSLFEEKGGLDAATGKFFLANILERGGSKDAMELFVAFRGRPPEVGALLRHSGIDGDISTAHD